MRRDRRGTIGRVAIGLAAVLCGIGLARAAHAKDLGDILLEKGLITPEELREAREEEQHKAAAAEKEKAAAETEQAAADQSRVDAIAAKLPKWLSFITPFGDLRTRYEGFYANDLNARNRFRLRARLGLKVNPTPEIGAGFRLASGNADDPISTNQTFERTFTRKPLNLDQAYLTLTPGETFGLEPGRVGVTAGKFGVNAYRVSELLFDDDLSPEGATETFGLFNSPDGVLRSVKLNTFQWVVDEISSASDPWMIGGQVVADTVLGDHGPNLTVAFADYHYEGLDDVARKFLERSSSNFNGQLAGNNAFTRDVDGKITGFASGFNIINGGGELNFGDVLGVSAGLFGEAAYNTQAESSGTGFATGFGFGKAGKDWYHNGLKNVGDWAVAYTYQRVGQDAVPSLFSYSDIDYVQANATQKGSTNVSANIVRFDYVLLPNFQLTAKAHFINALDRSESNAALDGNATLIRTQLDAMFKF
jgi:Putative porin